LALDIKLSATNCTGGLLALDTKLPATEPTTNFTGYLLSLDLILTTAESATHCTGYLLALDMMLTATRSDTTCTGNLPGTWYDAASYSVSYTLQALDTSAALYRHTWRKYRRKAADVFMAYIHMYHMRGLSQSFPEFDLLVDWTGDVRAQLIPIVNFSCVFLHCFRKKNQDMVTGGSPFVCSPRIKKKL
jgi:hypothetical protein